VYLQHFQLHELPFRITPDTSFFFSHFSHTEALNVLSVALNSGEGFIKITGEVGTGKTLLCRKLLKAIEVNGKFTSAYIPNPYLTPETLKMALAEELNIRFPRDISQHHLLELITSRLTEIHRSGKRVVVCLDEAQALPLESLEALRLLTNLETEKRKLIQVVLFGQPELDERLDEKSIRQLKQRITFSYRLRPMQGNSVADYVNYRLNIAGYKGTPLFTGGAIKVLQKGSAGVPRLINILSHKALMIAYGKGDRQISRQHMRMAVMDTEGSIRSWHTRLGQLLLGRPKTA